MATLWPSALYYGAGDKKHDSYATQFFVIKMLRWWQDSENFNEVIHSIHLHSDNAATHFKSNKTLNFLSRLKSLLGVPVTWSFGCPGHGKGPWDGFGGTLKRMCRQNALFLTVAFKTAADVAQHIRDMFCTPNWAEKHGLDSNYTINQVVVFEAALGEIERPVVAEEYDSVKSIQKSFGYMALRDGIVLQRWFDCWCPVCMSVISAGPTDDGPMDSNYRVPTCCSQEHWQGVASTASRNWWSGTFSQADAAALVVAEGEMTTAILALATLKQAATATAMGLEAATAAAAIATSNLAAAGLVSAGTGAQLVSAVESSTSATMAAKSRSFRAATSMLGAVERLPSTNSIVKEIKARIRVRGSEQGCPFRWWECRVESETRYSWHCRKEERSTRCRAKACT